MQNNPLYKKRNCNGMTPDFFFPTGKSGRRTFHGVPEGTDAMEKEHAKFCVGCPVMVECLEYALKERHSGVYGGTSTEERQSIRRRRLREALKQRQAS